MAKKKALLLCTLKEIQKFVTVFEQSLHMQKQIYVSQSVTKGKKYLTDVEELPKGLIKSYSTQSLGA